jgi:hypothetical protein
MFMCQNYHHSSCVYIAGIVMETFLQNDELFDGLFGVMDQFVKTTFSILSSVCRAHSHCVLLT